ncbi:MAG: type III pantothenate kinase [Nitrospirales bacterium]
MLLAIDIGNTNIVWGVFQDRTLKGNWRLATELFRTSDEYGILFLTLLRSEGIAPDQVTGVIISSVVPSLASTFESLSETYFHRLPLVVSPEMDTGLRLTYPNPQEIGSDRLVNATAAYDRYRSAVIIVDFGTATTFCTISSSGEYLGGAIAPGLGIAAEALFSRTAKLPRVSLTRPKSAIGKDTPSSMQAGLVLGYAGLVDTLVTRIQGELGYRTKVVATGGLASLIAAECHTIQEVLPFLTLEGLELLYRRSRGDT